LVPHNKAQLQGAVKSVQLVQWLSYPSKANTFISSLKHPQQLWGSPSLLFKEYQGLLPLG